jgi:ORF6N domain
MAKSISKKSVKVIPDETIVRKILLLRGRKVILDSDLANLYEVETKVLNQAVKRNKERFPSDFMFRLTRKEAEISRSQIVTLKQGQNIKHLPYAFTEQGIAMLSGILRSDKAIKMNIAIMRAFVEIRKSIVENRKIVSKLKLLEDRLGEHDIQLGKIYDAIEDLLDKKAEEENWRTRRRIGFK